MRYRKHRRMSHAERVAKRAARSGINADAMQVAGLLGHIDFREYSQVERMMLKSLLQTLNYRVQDAIKALS